MLKRIHKIVGHDMYIIDILVFGPYEDFQNKICLDMGVCFFCEDVYFSSRESEFVCVCVCF